GFSTLCKAGHHLYIRLLVKRLLSDRCRLYLQHLIEVDITHRALPAPATARVAVPLNGPSETVFDVDLRRPVRVTAQLGVVTLQVVEIETPQPTRVKPDLHIRYFHQLRNLVSKPIDSVCRVRADVDYV